MTAFDPLETYVHLPDGPDARPLEVTPEFWRRFGRRPELHGGRLVGAHRFTEDWTTWERHPAGDELVFQLSGAMDLLLDEGGRERRVELRGRSASVIPRGVRHTVRMLAPSEAIFITRGQGTEHRPATRRSA